MMEKLLEYRSGIVGVFMDDQGNILAGERRDFPGAWQLPQGGIEPGESALSALYREMKEELGCNDFKIINEARRLVKYRFPPDLDRPIARKYCGQAQQWFLARFDDGAKPDKSKADNEFVDFCWLPPQKILENIVDWKRSAYEEGFKLLNIKI